MSMFSNKRDSLDLELAKALPVEPVKIAEKLYVAFIELDTEILRCYGIRESQAQNIVARWARDGCYLQRGTTPTVYIPIHRIMKVTFRPEEEVKREDEK